MDSQDYLDQISRSARPVQPKGGIGNILSSKYFKWGAIAFGILIVTMILGMMLGGGKKEVTPQDRCIALRLHTIGTTEAINTYQPNLKSSVLRSLSASLQGILANTTSQLETYMEEAYGAKEGANKIDDEMAAADEYKEALKNDLFEAKINGLLDRVFAHKMTLEIYSIASEETSIINSLKDEGLKSALTNSYNSLDNLYTQFNDFSETKQ